MPSAIVERNYSKCPLKKRPVHFTFEDTKIKDEPENLSLKKEYSLSYESPSPIKIQRIELSPDEKPSLVVPTPQYPASLQPWNFHIPYPAQYYTSLYPHSEQISPLSGGIPSPRSTEGSLSPPPSYLQSRCNSISPPIPTEIRRPVIVNQSITRNIIKPDVFNEPHHRYAPYPIPYHQPYSLNFAPSPVSPAYSDLSFYSGRSHSPEYATACPAPEDLSKKIKMDSSASSVNFENRENVPNTTNQYKEKVSPPRYPCPDCNKSYSTYSGLTKHQQHLCPAAKGDQPKKKFSCENCDKTYESVGALKMHIKTHTLPCKCQICGKAFSRPWLLQGHIRTHTGEKPFSCQHCNRAFADRSNLRAHLQTHSDVKKYSCTSCSKTFSRMSLLTKHNEGGCPGSSTQIDSRTPYYCPQM